MRNYININEREYGRNIYRILTVERLVEMFEQEDNVLVKPALWDDPFENFVLNIPSKGRISGKAFKSAFRNLLYGQCWTLNMESDAMWRIYSPDKNGVKIQTTILKLFRSLHSIQKKHTANSSCFIGKVNYYSKKKIEQLTSDRMAGRQYLGGNIGNARALLFKRKAFEHEKEIRLIYLDLLNEVNSNIYRYPSDPQLLIDRITFDPRMNPKLYDIYKNHIVGIGYKGTIVQSGLYRSPRFT